MRIHDDSMVDKGIFAGDLLVVDRAEDTVSGNIIVARVEGEFFIRCLYEDRSGVRLCAGNPKFKDILIADLTDWEI